MSDRNKKLSAGAKQRALLMAAGIEMKAHYPAGHAQGYASDPARAEMREVADLLRAAGQPHAGKPDQGRALHAISVMRSTGWTAREAARYVLALARWRAEYEDEANTAGSRRALEAEFHDDLRDRMKEVPGKDITRLVTKIEAAIKDQDAAGSVT